MKQISAHESFIMRWQEGVLKWQKPEEPVARVMAPPGAPPIIILPGFGNARKDYTEPFGDKSSALVTHLEARGFSVYVPPLERGDWFKVARGLLTLKFWSSTLTTDPGYTWYLDRVAATVELARLETGSSQVDLIGHSAGGWLARAYLADPKYMSMDPGSVRALLTSDAVSGGGGGGSVPNPRVRSLVTLGSPQRPPLKEKGRDMTGGAQGWLDTSFPGAFFAPQGVRYTTVAGRTVRGHRDFPRQREGTRVPQEYAYDSYFQVCGDGEGIEGDCVVPLNSALLDGANQILLDGVYHSMSKIGTFEESSSVVWYGSDDVIDHWLHVLLPPAPSPPPEEHTVAESSTVKASSKLLDASIPVPTASTTAAAMALSSYDVTE
ncbi:MAG: hypothetical protein WDW38_000183 [Sanguina aurantia]